MIDVERQEIDFVCSLLEYSYKDEIENLVDDLRSLLQRIDSHPILFQLFENICRISSAIDLYTELFRESSEPPGRSQKSLLLKNLAALADRCQRSLNLLQSNEQTFRHLPGYLAIKNKFLRFDSFCQVNRPSDVARLPMRIWSLETLSRREERRATVDSGVSDPSGRTSSSED